MTIICFEEVVSKKSYLEPAILIIVLWEKVHVVFDIRVSSYTLECFN